MERQRKTGPALWVVVSIPLAVLLTWNFMTGTLCPVGDPAHPFSSFQADSETLVTGAILAERNGVKTGNYGMGRYYGLSGGMLGYEEAPPPEAEGYDGYFSLTEPLLRVKRTGYTDSITDVEYIKFAGGTEYKVLRTECDDTYFYMYLDAPGPVSAHEAGDLSGAEVYGPSHEALPKGFLGQYASQFGLQGYFFRFLARFMGDNYRPLLNLLCAAMTAAVFTAIVLLAVKKYNILFSACFYAVFLLSPWIVNFARNLYWVEFTWFLPMLFGLICSIWTDTPAVRRLCYAGCFLSVLVKCLCGYEYISAVMASSVGFLSADLIGAAVKRDKKQSLKVFKALCFIGILEVAAFALALCIHGYLRGQGDVVEGLGLIYRQDVLRRTWGASKENLTQDYWASLDASALDVLEMYFEFRTPVLTGLPAWTFPYLAWLPVAIYISRWILRHFSAPEAALYLVFLLSPLSWYVLAKSHSYIHTHMSYVLWYFGFVQICVYSVLKFLAEIAGCVAGKITDGGGQ